MEIFGNKMEYTNRTFSSQTGEDAESKKEELAEQELELRQTVACAILLVLS